MKDLWKPIKLSSELAYDKQIKMVRVFSVAGKH
jgi:hypothetical protein